MSILLSVITTVYNREEYLAECIGSVLSSSFKNYEYIIVDDSSSDHSYDIALEFAKRDSRIRVYRNEKNLKEFANRNLAASYAKGKFLKYIDSDDIIYPHTLGLMVGAMQMYPEAAFGLSHYQIDPPRPQPLLFNPDEAYGEHYLKRGFLHYGPSLSIIKKSVFDEIGGFGLRPLFSDMILWLEIGKNHPSISLPPGLVWWRRHDGQEYAQVATFVQPMIDRFKINLSFLEQPDCPLLDDRKRAIKRLKQSYARKIWSRLSRGNLREALTILKQSDQNIWEILSGLRPYN